jgi:hypothetical protein
MFLIAVDWRLHVQYNPTPPWTDESLPLQAFAAIAAIM